MTINIYFNVWAGVELRSERASVAGREINMLSILRSYEVLPEPLYCLNQFWLAIFPNPWSAGERKNFHLPIEGKPVLQATVCSKKNLEDQEASAFEAHLITEQIWLCLLER